MTEAKCLNCGVEITEETLQELAQKKARVAALEAELNELSEEITALEAGYCGVYCHCLAEERNER